MSQSTIITRSLAAVVHHHANVAFYQTLLTALEAALRDEGYTLGEHPGETVEFPPSVREKLARAIVRSRITHISPAMKGEHVRDDIDNAIEDGYGEQWLTTLLAGLAAEGVYPALSGASDSAAA